MAEKKGRGPITVVTDSEQLGAHAVPGGISFCIAPDTQEPVYLEIYNRQTGKHLYETEMPFHALRGRIRSVQVSGFQAGQISYCYRTKEMNFADPAAAWMPEWRTYGIDHSGQYMAQICTRNFDWQDETGPLQIPYQDVTAYLLHVRGFTKQRGSGVRHPGTFKGLEEKIPYLQDLGINQVILMPAYEFNEYVEAASTGTPEHLRDQNGQKQGRVNFWGYGRGLYFAPKAAYAAGAYPDLEFKSLVRALHLAGIELVMEFAFTDDIPVSYMIQCLLMWRREYHVDGFVLLAGRDKVQAAASEPGLRFAKVMASGIDARAAYPLGRKIDTISLADMNDGFRADARRMLKSDANELWNFTEHMKRSERDKAVVNYITGHDGFTLMDLVSYNVKHNEPNDEGGRDGADTEFSWNCGQEGPTRKKNINRLRLQQMKNAFCMLLLAAGTPMLRAGDEFGNTQDGNSNPWCQDNECTWLDWKAAKNNRELYDFVKELIAFRKRHALLHSAATPGSAEGANGFPGISLHADRAWYVSYEPEMRHVGIMLCGTQGGEETFLYIACNFHWEPREFAMPYLPENMEWQMRFHTLSESEGLTESETRPERSAVLPGRCICVYEAELVLKKENDEEMLHEEQC